MQTDKVLISPQCKLTPKGNQLWCDMLDNDTLPEPMADIVMESLKNYNFEHQLASRPSTYAKEEWLRSPI